MAHIPPNPAEPGSTPGANPQGRDAVPQAPGGPPTPSAAKLVPRPPNSWFATHGRDLRFLVVFGVLMGAYYVLFSVIPALEEKFIPWYLKFNAYAAADVLHAFGYSDVTSNGKALNSSGGAISVERGCDAITPTALLVSAVLASPVAFGSKVPAVLAGALILAVVNLIRIISLFLSAVHWREAFDILHLEVWQGAFILLSILLWAWWAAWATKRPKRQVRV